MNNKVFIYNRSLSGLGDLLSGLCTVWNYCNKYNIDIIVDWSNSSYLQDSTNIYSFLFRDCKIGNVNIVAKNVDKNHIINPVIDNEKINRFEFKDKIYNKTYIKGKELVSGSKGSLIFRANEDIYTNENIYFFNELTKYLQEDVKGIILKNRTIIFNDSNQYLGIQIRNGNGEKYYNFGTDCKGSFVIGEEEKNKLVKKVMSVIKILYKKYSVFLATDSKDIRDMIIEKDNSIKYCNQWYPDNGKESHWSVLNNCPNPKKTIIDAFVDMNLLSCCNIIYSFPPKVSTFVAVAALLNGGTKIIN